MPRTYKDNSRNDLEVSIIDNKTTYSTTGAGGIDRPLLCSVVPLVAEKIVAANMAAA